MCSMSRQINFCLPRGRITYEPQTKTQIESSHLHIHRGVHHYSMEYPDNA
jgi:hypothetical protein